MKVYQCKHEMQEDESSKRGVPLYKNAEINKCKHVKILCRLCDSAVLHQFYRRKQTQTV